MREKLLPWLKIPLRVFAASLLLLFASCEGSFHNPLVEKIFEKGEKDGTGQSGEQPITDPGGQDGPIIISSAAITVTAPVKGRAPDTAASPGGAGYSCGGVSWSPAGDLFLGGQEYTATATLTAHEGYAFAVGLSAYINTRNADVISYSAGTITISLTFDATFTKTVVNITIADQPSRRDYTHGDSLELDGLRVILTFDDQTAQTIAAADFGTTISTIPEKGARLSHIANNETPVNVYYDNLIKTTAVLYVTQKSVSITAARVLDKEYDGTTTANIISYGVDGNIDGSDLTASGTAVFEDKNAGNGKTVLFSNWSLGGPAAGNYDLQGQTPNGTGNITPRQLTISAPTVTTPKPYDGNTNATITAMGTLGNKIEGDSVNIGAAVATYNSKNVLEANTITVVYTIGGNDAANYIKPADSIVPGTITKAGGGYVDPPEAATISATSVTLTAVSASNGQPVQYAVSGSNSAPTEGWQSETTFGNLSPGTTYYFFARSAADDNHNAGAASTGMAITTALQIGENIIVYYWVDDTGEIAIGDMDGQPFGNPVTVTNGGSITFSAAGDGYTGHSWTLNGTAGGTGSTYTFDGSDKESNRNYTVGLTVQKDGNYYYTQITVRIEQ